MGDCVFCRIVAGGEPCSRVHEDDVSLGFMGIHPARPGELMVIPKEHIGHFCDLSDDLTAHILLVAQRLSRAIRRTLSPKRVGLLVHGFGVPHAHLLVVPQHEPTDIVSGRHIRLEEGRISFGTRHLRSGGRCAPSGSAWWYMASASRTRMCLEGGRIAFGTRHLEVPRHVLDTTAASLPADLCRGFVAGASPTSKLAPHPQRIRLTARRWIPRAVPALGRVH